MHFVLKVHVLAFMTTDHNLIAELHRYIYTNFKNIIIFVFDKYVGPMAYNSKRDHKTILLKSGGLEKNIFELLEKRSQSEHSEFQYVLNKYFEQAWCILYITNWLNNNLSEIVPINDKIKGLFHIQYLHHKKHFETLLKLFYPSKDTIPLDSFNAAHIIETYFNDITKIFEKTNNITSNDSISITQSEKPLNNINGGGVIHKKEPLITQKEAEKDLLKTIFNIEQKNED